MEVGWKLLLEWSCLTILLSQWLPLILAQEYCDESDCLPGSCCLSSQCVRIPCDRTLDCPTNGYVCDFSLGVPQDQELCYKTGETGRDIMARLRPFNRRCCSDDQCPQGQECVFLNVRLHEACRRTAGRARRGFCRHVYASCTVQCDCPGPDQVCIHYRQDVKGNGKCICAHVDPAKCGPKCRDSSDCEDRCQICLNHACTRSPGIRDCAEEQKDSCQRRQIDSEEDKAEICPLEGDRECCSSCDCINKCRGTKCDSCSGKCEGPIPWFCDTGDRLLGGEYSMMCSPKYAEEHCFEDECCYNGSCTPNEECPEEMKKEGMGQCPASSDSGCFLHGQALTGEVIPRDIVGGMTEPGECQIHCHLTQDCDCFSLDIVSGLCLPMRNCSKEREPEVDTSRIVSGFYHCKKQDKRGSHECAQGYRLARNGKCYKLLSARHGWKSAFDICSKDRAILSVPAARKDLFAIRKLFPSLDSFWTGLKVDETDYNYDLNCGDTFHWSVSCFNEQGVSGFYWIDGRGRKELFIQKDPDFPKLSVENSSPCIYIVAEDLEEGEYRFKDFDCKSHLPAVCEAEIGAQKDAGEEEKQTPPPEVNGDFFIFTPTTLFENYKNITPDLVRTRISTIPNIHSLHQGACDATENIPSIPNKSLHREFFQPRTIWITYKDWIILCASPGCFKIQRIIGQSKWGEWQKMKPAKANPRIAFTHIFDTVVENGKSWWIIYARAKANESCSYVSYLLDLSGWLTSLRPGPELPLEVCAGTGSTLSSGETVLFGGHPGTRKAFMLDWNKSGEKVHVKPIGSLNHDRLRPFSCMLHIGEREEILVTGGRPAEEDTSVEAYNSQANRWRMLAGLPALMLERSLLFVLNGYPVMIACGSDNSCLESIYEYIPRTNIWLRKPFKYPALRKLEARLSEVKMALALPKKWNFTCKGSN